jgi:hypothetical protein
MTMEHRFTYPTVTEKREAHRAADAPPARLSQRELVAASLLKCPKNDKAVR